MNIPLAQLKHGFVYKIRARNFSIGVFDRSNNSFVGIRHKFENDYLDRELEHTTSAHFGTATAIEELGSCPIMELRISLGVECGKCGAEMKFIARSDETPISDGGTVRGLWAHIDKPDCGMLAPYGICNEELFNWLRRFRDQRII